jgi:hypothetical protein
MKPTMSRYHHTMSARERNKALVKVAILGVTVLLSVSAAMAQVYGVARKTTVVSGPNGTAAVSKTAVVSGPNGTAAVSKTTVVSGGGMPHGYIAVLPGGYRAVTISGVRYYSVGGIYYRPQIYQGRTVYVAVRL